MASPFKTSPLKTGRLSLLSSDIEEDLGLIDFNDSQFDFLSKDEFWLFDDESLNGESYSKIYDWINCCFSQKEDDPYFVVSNIRETPSNGLGRFDYLTKSVSRTATITRRKIENEEVSTPQQSRFGTITKRPIQNPRGSLSEQSIKGNRTYDVLEENGFSDGTNDQTFSDNNSDSSGLVRNRPQLHAPKFMPNSPANTNTITKNRRIFAGQNYDSSENDVIGGDVASDLNSTYGIEELTSDEISNNADLNRQPQMNRTFDKITSDTDNSINVPSNDGQSSRNYPTISRNITRTLLRREASQGHLTYSNQMQQPQAHFTTSNDDLLSSDSSSVLSARSNLTMTSSISGRSEPNLAHTLTVLGATNQNKKLPTRPMFGANKPSQLASKIARPSSQNGPVNGLARKPASNSSNFGSMNSLQQSNMARTSSQIRHPNIWANSATSKLQPPRTATANASQKSQVGSRLPRQQYK